MSVMVTEVYDAFLSAKADEQKARAAATAIAASDDVHSNRYQELRSDIQKLQGEMTLLKWMMGLVIATNLAIILRVFTS